MANVLVAYASRHGFTEGMAERIAAVLRTSGQTAEVRQFAAAGDLAGYDAYVIGSAVYMGSWLRQATEFVRANRELLARRPVWLFSSGPLGTATSDAEGRDLRTQAEPRQYAEFRAGIDPRDLKVFFGGLESDRLRFGERLIRSTPAGRRLMPEGDFRDWNEIETWAHAVAHELLGIVVDTH